LEKLRRVKRVEIEACFFKELPAVLDHFQSFAPKLSVIISLLPF
jgi:hypothetical protein